jgi:hypothetical protein
MSIRVLEIGMKASSSILRFGLAAALIVAYGRGVCAQIAVGSAPDHVRIEDQLWESPVRVPTWVPEFCRADYVRMVQAERDLHELRPLFMHVGLAVLEEIREMERRPVTHVGEWALPLQRRHASADCGLVGPGRTALVAHGGPQPWSADELDVHRGGVQRRLIRLAISGRITKEEYDGMVRRLQGN